MCSHPHTGDATAEKIAGKNRENFNKLNFLRQNHGLCRQVQPPLRAGDATFFLNRKTITRNKLTRVAAA